MKEIIEEYGRTLLSIIAAAAIMLIFTGGGQEGIAARLLTGSQSGYGIERVSASSNGISAGDDKLDIVVSKKLAAGEQYSLLQIISADNDAKFTGGNIIFADKVYDPDELEEGFSNDVEYEGDEILFLKQGLYHLCVSVACENGTDFMTDIYVAVGEE